MYIISGNKIISEVDNSFKVDNDGILYQDNDITSIRYKFSFGDTVFYIADVSVLVKEDSQQIKVEKEKNGISNLWVDDKKNIIIVSNNDTI